MSAEDREFFWGFAYGAVGAFVVAIVAMSLLVQFIK
jgi:hypothetical protein